jgi:D-sedoheptulose 7-phosphate isomerase
LNNSISISAIGADEGGVRVFAKHIEALGSPNDVLVTLSYKQKTNNIVEAVQSAHDKQMKVISLTGGMGGEEVHLLQPDDIEVRAPVLQEALIHEVHLTSLNILCDLIDFQLFGEYEAETQDFMPMDFAT